MNYIKKVIPILKKSGASLKKDFVKISRTPGKYKGPHEMVTKSDLKAEKIIISELRKKFPTHSIFSEEAGHVGPKSEYQWLVDPLDGTHNFMRKLPIFCTMVALVKNDKIILGAIYVPVMDFMFTAEIGKGAYLNGKKIKVSNVSNLKKSLLVYCHSSNLANARWAIQAYSHFRSRNYHIKQYGSAGVELAWVAAGWAESYFSRGLKPWDAAPGYLIAKEAGAKITKLDGKEWNLKSDEILCSNGKVHSELLRVFKKIGRKG